MEVNEVGEVEMEGKYAVKKKTIHLVDIGL